MTSDYPIKTCDYCPTTGVMCTFMNGETVCDNCLTDLPVDIRDARRMIVELRAKVKAAELAVKGKNTSEGYWL